MERSTKLSQSEIDVKNLRFYSKLFEQYHWETPIIHWSVFHQTLLEIAARIEAKQPEVSR